MWYTQSDSLAMGASLTAVLSNFWMNSFENFLQKQYEGVQNIIPNIKGTCIDCNRRVNFQGKGAEWELWENWFKAKCQTDTMSWSIRNCRKLYGFVPLCRKRYEIRHTVIQIIQKVCR